MLSLELELAEIDIQKRLATRAELQALQAQISPHFLFNTLNTIASYCRRDGVKAEEMLVEFAELFRRNLKRHRGLVRVQEELDFVDSYLRFEQYRFGERLKVEHDHEKEALSVRVPPLILQPLVENAIAHGVTSRVGRSTVWIQSYVIDEDVIIAVQDDGVGMDPDILSQPEATGRLAEGEGIGLRNVQRRLQGVYGHDYGLRISSPPEGGTRVEVRIPRRAPRFVFSSVGAGIASEQANRPAGEK
jgi:LytS/YehU family sensor histidine kinase